MNDSINQINNKPQSNKHEIQIDKEKYVSINQIKPQTKEEYEIKSEEGKNIEKSKQTQKQDTNTGKGGTQSPKSQKMERFKR